MTIPKNILVILITIMASNAYSQCHYSLKTEAGYLYYLDHTITIDSNDPEWKGYNLNDGQSGINFNIINGIRFRENYMTGAGLGYLNFEGIHGMAVFADLEYTPLNRKFNPIFNIKAGYNHIWNQYDNGTGSAMGEIGAGFRYMVNKKIGVRLQVGVSRTQQVQFFPLRLGLDF